MRLKYSLVVLLIAIVGTTTIPLTGQEEPLPVIHAKGSFEPLAPEIVLAVYPIRGFVPPTLAEAARENDFTTFDALYRDALKRGQPVSAFTALHELWTYSVTDPIGAFYGADMHARLSRAYPGYATYIEQYRIVDSNGNAFYPTSETRTFLLDRALEGRAPSVQLADGSTTRSTRSAAASTPIVSSAVSANSTSGNSTSTRSTSTRSSSSSASSATVPSTRRQVPARPRTRAASSERAATTTAPASRTATPRATVPVREATTPKTAGTAIAEKASPVVVAENPPAAVAEPAPAPATIPVAEAPVVVQAEPRTADVPAAIPQAATTDNHFGSRGVFLLLIGIIGIGILAIMLRTPREVPASIMTPTPSTAVPPPPSGDKPAAPVEPLRRPSAASPTPSGKNRASGSHG